MIINVIYFFRNAGLGMASMISRIGSMTSPFAITLVIVMSFKLFICTVENNDIGDTHLFLSKNKTKSPIRYTHISYLIRKTNKWTNLSPFLQTDKVYLIFLSFHLTRHFKGKRHISEVSTFKVVSIISGWTRFLGSSSCFCFHESYSHHCSVATTRNYGKRTPYHPGWDESME